MGECKAFVSFQKKFGKNFEYVNFKDGFAWYGGEWGKLFVYCYLTFPTKPPGRGKSTTVMFYSVKGYRS